MKSKDPGAGKPAANTGANSRRAVNRTAGAAAPGRAARAAGLKESSAAGGVNYYNSREELLPVLVKAARAATPDVAEQEARVLSALCAIEGRARWTPEMVMATNREMGLCCA